MSCDDDDVSSHYKCIRCQLCFCLNINILMGFEPKIIIQVLFRVSKDGIKLPTGRLDFSGSPFGSGCRINEVRSTNLSFS